LYFVLNSNVVKTIEEANNLFITHNGFFIIIYIRFILVFLYYRYYFNYQKRFLITLYNLKKKEKKKEKFYINIFVVYLS